MGYFKNLDANAPADTPLPDAPEPSPAYVAALYARLYAKCDALMNPAQAEDDDPVCVCGVYRSEHALCGCGEWERRRL